MRKTALRALPIILAFSTISAKASAQTSGEPPTRAFSGFGLGLGGGSNDVSITVRGADGRVKVDGNDGEFWVFANYNVAIDDRWLVGIDAEASIFEDQSTAEDLPPGVLDGFLFDGGWSISVRGGYAFSDRILGYARAGFVQQDIGDPDFNGVQIGGGVEVRLFWLLGLRAEVAHNFLENRSLGEPAVRVSPSSTSVRGGLVFRF